MLKREIPITQAMIDGYGRINGDNDIIHYDHAYALQRGFRGTLLHGPHMTAFGADLGAKAHGADWLTRGRLVRVWCQNGVVLMVVTEAGEIVDAHLVGYN